MPGGVAKSVDPGRKRRVHVFPPLVEVAQPMFEAPPLKNRPDWKAETTVFPNVNVSGSTWVLWLLPGLVYGSLLICVSVSAARTAVADPRTRNNDEATVMSPIIPDLSRLMFRGIEPPLQARRGPGRPHMARTVRLKSMCDKVR